jgi:probable HAF family extracellular repeat protein
VIALNNAGDLLIAEGVMAGSSPLHYALFSPTNRRFTDLTTLPGGSGLTATALNNKDQVVGTNFLFSNGQITSLQSLLPSTSHWSNLDATGINDAGQIVGQGLIDGQEHAFLMSPQAVPEPSSLVLFGFGFAAIAIRSLLRRV